MPEIAFIMGKSASGKDKIYKNLIEDESLKLNTVILYTTCLLYTSDAADE